MRKKVFIYCFLLLTLTMLMLPKAQAYLVGTTIYKFEKIQYLPNGYRVGMVGVGQVTSAPLGMNSGANASVQVVKTKETKSQLKNIRLTYITYAYFLEANIKAPFKGFTLEQSVNCSDSGYSLCSFTGMKQVVGATVFPTTRLYAELTFSDGAYTVYADQK